MSTKYGRLTMGGSIKYMYGQTYFNDIAMGDKNNLDNFDIHRKSTHTYGIDMGSLYEPRSDLRIGLVAKNLNTPKFAASAGHPDFEVKPMIRTGIAYDIFDSLELAADYDLTSNNTFLGKSQMFGGGLNFEPASWFSVRGGMKKNMDSSDNTGLIYTAGLGFGLKWLQIDVTGEMSSGTGTVNGSSYRKYSAVNFALISKF
jgi:hypothetical protein